MKKKIMSLSTAVSTMMLSAQRVICGTSANKAASANWTVGENAGDSTFQLLSALYQHWAWPITLLSGAVLWFASDNSKIRPWGRRVFLLSIVLYILSFASGMNILYDLFKLLASFFGYDL